MVNRGVFDSKSGKAVLVAFDYGMNGTVHQEAKNPGETMSKFMSAQPDAVLSSPILINKYLGLFNKYPSVTPVATLDAFTRTPSLYGPMQVYDFDYAIRLGARAIKCFIISGQTESRVLLENFQYVARVGEQTHKHDVPFIIEAVNWGAEIPEEKKNDPEEIHKVCRFALELGADIIKTEYTGDPVSFKEITSCLPIPVMILGGSKGELKDVFSKVQEAIGAGARGVVFGRNIYKAQFPDKMVEALKALVHSGMSVADAIQIVKK
ncbi:MAG: hypothetical protein PHR43_04685 [Dehalococcoidales bacterium]|nr:hypothetical protein [Dehalococcoidales bacterium]